MRASWRHYLWFVCIAAGGCALDLVTKAWVFGRLGMPLVEQGSHSPPIWLIDNIFGFETSLNEGALFGMGQGQVVVVFGPVDRGRRGDPGVADLRPARSGTFT